MSTTTLLMDVRARLQQARNGRLQIRIRIPTMKMLVDAGTRTRTCSPNLIIKMLHKKTRQPTFQRHTTTRTLVLLSSTCKLHCTALYVMVGCIRLYICQYVSLCGSSFANQSCRKTVACKILNTVICFWRGRPWMFSQMSSISFIFKTTHFTYITSCVVA